MRWNKESMMITSHLLFGKLGRARNRTWTQTRSSRIEPSKSWVVISDQNLSIQMTTSIDHSLQMMCSQLSCISLQSLKLKKDLFRISKNWRRPWRQNRQNFKILWRLVGLILRMQLHLHSVKSFQATCTNLNKVSKELKDHSLMYFRLHKVALLSALVSTHTLDLQSRLQNNSKMKLVMILSHLPTNLSHLQPRMPSFN